MILLAFTQLLGLNEKILLDVGKKLDASDIEHYIASIKTIQKEKSLVLFNATCQQLIKLSDNPHFISIAYKRVLMDIGYSSEESDAILDKSYFNNRDIESFKPNHNSSSISDLDIMVDYFGKQKNKAENELKKLYTPISEQEDTFIEDEESPINKNMVYTNKTIGHILDNSDYWDAYCETWMDRPFIYNWKFSDFIDTDSNIQIKEAVNNLTGEYSHFLIIINEWDLPCYIRMLDTLSMLEIIEQKEELLVGITKYGNFWLHNGREISGYEQIY